MDINNIALIILTAFINLAVTNYIFYRYQKKIEETFAKSMLEYQTKFVRNYEKTVETLEHLYKKYADIEMSLQLVCKKLSGAMLDALTYDNMHETLSKKILDFRDYFYANRLYLSQDVADLIFDMQALNSLILMLLGVVMLGSEKDAPTNEMLDYMSAIIEQHNSVLKKTLLTSDFASKNITDVRLVFWKAYEEMNLRSERLEKIYQSLAQVNQ